MELEEDVVVECPATPQLQESRPIERQRLALDEMVDFSRRAAQFLSRLEQRTSVLVLEIKMPRPNVTIITDNNPDFGSICSELAPCLSATIPDHHS